MANHITGFPLFLHHFLHSRYVTRAIIRVMNPPDTSHNANSHISTNIPYRNPRSSNSLAHAYSRVFTNIQQAAMNEVHSDPSISIAPEGSKIIL